MCFITLYRIVLIQCVFFQVLSCVLFYICMIYYLCYEYMVVENSQPLLIMSITV